MELPKQRIGKKTYYVDMRLREFRNVENPYDRIDFDDLYHDLKIQTNRLC